MARSRTTVAALGIVATLALGVGGYAMWHKPVGTEARVEAAPLRLDVRPERVAVVPMVPPIRAAWEDATRACSDWHNTGASLITEEAARALTLCNVLLPGERVSVSVPGSRVAISLDGRSVAVGAALSLLTFCALLGLRHRKRIIAETPDEYAMDVEVVSEGLWRAHAGGSHADWVKRPFGERLQWRMLAEGVLQEFQEMHPPRGAVRAVAQDSRDRVH